MCISTEEIIIMKDGKLFLSSTRSFSHLRIQIFSLINHLCCINTRCVEEMLSKKFGLRLFNSAPHQRDFNTHTLLGSCVHTCVYYAADVVTQLHKIER